MGCSIRKRKNIGSGIKKGVRITQRSVFKTGLGIQVESCEVNPMDFSKLSSLARRSGAVPKFAPDTQVSGIVTVKKKGYFPKNLNIKVRSWIGDRIFTADFLAGEIPAIEKDPHVAEVAISEAIPLQKLPQG